MGTIAQNDLYRLIGEANARSERVVVATVAHTRGSTPQRRGAKMLFFESGQTAGTVGGGCVEAEVWAEARETMRSGLSSVIVVPSSALDSMNLGAIGGISALGQLAPPSDGEKRPAPVPPNTI